jgi:hypothetical protein
MIIFFLFHWCSTCFHRYGLQQVLRKLLLKTRVYFEIIFIGSSVAVFTTPIFESILVETLCTIDVKR